VDRSKTSRVCREFADLVTFVTVHERKKGDHLGRPFVPPAARRLFGSGGTLRTIAEEFDCAERSIGVESGRRPGCIGKCHVYSRLPPAPRAAEAFKAAFAT